MITLTTSGDSVVFNFDNNGHYLQEGTIEVPKNSLSLVIDSSDMVTFKKAASNDVFVSATLAELGMTKEQVISFYEENMVAPQGGGGGGVDVVQTTGTSTADVMSQDAVTTGLNNKANKTAAFGGYQFGSSSDSDYIQYKNVDNSNIGNSIYYPKINGKGILTSNQIYARNNYNFSLVETSAITTSVTSSSTDSEIPTAKAVYDVLSGKTSVVNVTQAEYDALVSGGTVDPTILYNITDATPQDMSQYWTSAQTNSAITQAVSGKQDTLVSGTNIKTINNESLLGSGNIDIQGGGGTTYTAGRGINITNDTISFNLSISAGTGTRSIVEGATTSRATGTNSHAEGSSTRANGEESHAEGYNTTANTSYSHAEGNSTKASGPSSHAEGTHTITNNASEHASGLYNVSSKASTTFGDSGNTLFSVGNGTADNARHNAFEIRQNGDIYITSGGTDIKLQDNLGGGSVSSAVTSGDTNAVSSDAVYTAMGGLKLQQISQADYDALVSGGTVDASTLYIITNVVN